MGAFVDTICGYVRPTLFCAPLEETRQRNTETPWDDEKHDDKVSSLLSHQSKNSRKIGQF